MPNNQQPGALILVFADDEEIRDGIQALLEADGYRIHGARNEEDAVDLAMRKRPELILVSLGQSSDSTTSASQVRIRAGLSERVPIVLFSIPTIEEGAEIELGKNIFATHPDNFDQLRRLLGRLLGQAPATC